MRSQQSSGSSLGLCGLKLRVLCITIRLLNKLLHTYTSPEGQDRSGLRSHGDSPDVAVRETGLYWLQPTRMS